MPSLPPSMWAEIYFDSAWNPVSVRQTSPVTVKRGLSSESTQTAAPTSSQLTVDNRDHTYSPRNPNSDLFGKIGRNTPARWGYNVGSPWAEMDGGLTYNSLFVLDDPALDVSGDFDLRVEVAPEDWSESQMIAVRYVTTGDQRCWALEILNGIPTFLWSPDGTLASRIDEAATEAVKGYNGQRIALRVTLDIDNGASGYELRFYTGRTVDDDDDDWVLLGSPVIGGSTTSVYTGSAYMEVGGGFSFNSTPGGGSLNRLAGKAYALKLLDSGTVKVSMSMRSATPGGTDFTDDTGLTWSRGGTAVLTNRHIRMSGEMPEWPSVRDKSGNDNTVTLAPTDVTRRMDAGNKPQDSALLRYIRANDPLECYPLTDGELSTTGTPLQDGNPMTVSLDSGTQQPKWAGGTINAWTEKVVTPELGTDGTMRGQVVPNSGADSGWSTDYFFSGLLDGSLDYVVADAGAGTDADNRIGFSLTIDQDNDQITLYIVALGETSVSSTLLSTVSSPAVFDNNTHHIRITATPNSPNTDWELYVDGVSVDSGSHALVVRRLLFMQPGWFLGSVTQGVPSFGYLTYWDSSGPTAANMWDAVNGFPGERAGARIERLASEAGYTASVAGVTAQQELLGVQGLEKTLALLNSASRTNFGYVVGARDRAEVIHRGHSTLWNQPPGLTIDFSAGLIDSYTYRDDDLLTENDVSVQRQFGSVPSRKVLDLGTLSVLEPPDGVGRYDSSYTYSLYTDSQAPDTASMLLHLGTFDGIRYPKVTLNLANERVFQMIDAILRLDVGDKIRLTNLPADHGPDDVDVLVAGYTETAGPKAWTISFVCVPAQPWAAFVLGYDTYDRLDTAGCTLDGAVAVADTSVDVVTATGSVRWADSATYPDEFPFYVRVGGEVMRVDSCTGTTNSQTFGVTRGVNGVQIAHASGQDISLAYPAYLAL